MCVCLKVDIVSPLVDHNLDVRFEQTRWVRHNGEKVVQDQGTSHHSFIQGHSAIVKTCSTLRKSAHATLAVKACLLGGISYTKCSMTFVNMVIAISALAGGEGPKNGFAPRPQVGGVFEIFRQILGV